VAQGKVVGVFVWEDKAYVPILGRTEAGFVWETGQLLTASLTLRELTRVLEEAARVGNPSMRHPSQAEFRRPTPVQKAMGFRSWREMAEAGVIRCVIWWEEDRIGVAFSPRGAGDLQETDFAHRGEFELGASLEAVAEYILREVGRRRGDTFLYRQGVRGK